MSVSEVLVEKHRPILQSACPENPSTAQDRDAGVLLDLHNVPRLLIEGDNVTDIV